MVRTRYASSARRVTKRDAKEVVSFDNVADLIHRLGDIPAERILMDPPPGTATEEDLLRLLEGSETRIAELIDGVLVEKPVGAKESLLGIWLGHALWSFAEDKDLGVVLGEGAPTRFRLGLVRLPDVSFVSWKRIPNEEFPDDGVSGIIPDLAIEILSKSNTKREIELKLDEYFNAGVQVAWIINPRTKSAKIYTSRERFQTIGVSGVLIANRVLPGFSLTLRELFGVGKRRPGRKPPRK